MARLSVVVVMLAMAQACGSSSGGGKGDAVASSDGTDSTSSVTTRGVTDDKSATEAVVTLDDRLDKLAASATVEPKADSVLLHIPCDRGAGTVQLTSTSDGAGTTSARYHFVLTACVRGEESYSGEFDWTTAIHQTLTAGSGYVELNGTLAYDGPTYAGNFAFNVLRIAYTSSESGLTYTVSGTYSIGGTTYDVDSTALAGLF